MFAVYTRKTIIYENHTKNKPKPGQRSDSISANYFYLCFFDTVLLYIKTVLIKTIENLQSLLYASLSLAVALLFLKIKIVFKNRSYCAVL